MIPAQGIPAAGAPAHSNKPVKKPKPKKVEE